MTERPVLPGSTIGVVGGGQLGRMFILEARRMGYRCVVLDPDADAPAALIADTHLHAPLTDLEAARELAALSDVVTLEWENADVGAVRALERIVPVRPGSHVLEVAQNRLLEKRTARRLGLHTAEFSTVRSLRELEQGLDELGTPAILKTATGGYDGKGQRVIRAREEASSAFHELEEGGAELILEAWVPFTREASVICARGADGSLASFPVVENIHHRGILDFTLAPADLPGPVRHEAVAIGETLAAGLDVVGLLAVELFITPDERVLVNEIAPRPHNSGHYTWEACSVSQFEQQLRAVCGLPLARPFLHRPAVMANLLGEHIGNGEDLPALVGALETPLLSLHLYGKREGRPGRKMGHLTLLCDDPRRGHEVLASTRATIAAAAARSAPGSRQGRPGTE